MPVFGKYVTEEIIEKTKTHPCYSSDAKDYARMHLAVAPKCNIQCNYCNRKYDCQNESRPGVTSEVLSPQEALEKYKIAKEMFNKLTVVGIAGPGDAMANYAETKETYELIKAYDESVIFCLSTNGLDLMEHVDELLSLGVTHFTITINTIFPEVAAKIYKYITVDGKRIEGIEAGEIIVKRQFDAIRYLSQKNVLVKVNIVYIKGLNDDHIDKVVKRAALSGAAMTNIMPLIPTKETAFENYPKPTGSDIMLARKKCEKYVTQMYHCKQCRSDAVGTLGDQCTTKQIG
jgi:nitrogenase cofactor biosynthesis protein NifB